MFTSAGNDARENRETRMNFPTKERIQEVGGEAILFDVPMSRHTTFRAGGRAEALYRAVDLEGLRKMVTVLTDENVPYLVIGRGSNLLVRDGGLGGVVIVLQGSFASIEQAPDKGALCRAGAGVSLNRLVDFCAEEGLSGAEFLAGIPGTVGGAVAMNAGSWGHEIKDVIRDITVLGEGGIVERRDKSSLMFAYRGLDLPKGDIILDALLGLKPDDPEDIRKRIIANNKKRKAMLPFEMPSAGSVFKNPEGDFAGRLIEAVGLKGARIGGAMISEKHANVIVNTGKASAADILALMDLAAARVKEAFNKDLIPEVKVAGKQ